LGSQDGEGRGEGGTGTDETGEKRDSRAGLTAGTQLPGEKNSDFWQEQFASNDFLVGFRFVVPFWVDLGRPVVFIHYPHSNPHSSQMGRVWVENYYPLKKWVGWVWGGYK
jgi:hypothetical protein